MNTTTAAEYRKMAKESREAAHESFERCDTDGFLSQWASDEMARRYELQASMAENGWRWTFVALFDTSGNLIDNARYVETRYGWAWVIDTEDGPEWFNPSHARDGAKRRERDERKGYRKGRIEAPAYMTKRGHIERDRYSDGPVTVVSDGTGDNDYLTR